MAAEKPAKDARSTGKLLDVNAVAGSGLLDRRLFLTHSFALAGARYLPALAGAASKAESFPD